MAFIPINERSSVPDKVYAILMNWAPYSGLAEEWDRVQELSFSELPKHPPLVNDGWSEEDLKQANDFFRACEHDYVVVHVGDRECAIKRTLADELKQLVASRF
jgi:hypothetical protein